MASYSDNPLRHAWFVKFNFLSGPYYVWQGFRPLIIDGTTWQAVGPRGVVEQIEDAVADRVPQIILSVSGVDGDLLAKALASSSEIRGQLAFVYDGFFDGNWQLEGGLAVYAIVRMDTIKVSKSRQAEEEGRVSWIQTIVISCENYLTNGPCPPFGRYSSEDQWARQGNTDDLYFQYMAINQNRRQRWPTF